jgi:sialate O-acetylesterase
MWTVSQDSLHARLQVNRLFSDGMVLQQGREIPVWGTATPGAGIRLAFNKQHLVAVADEKGNWMGRLPAQVASAEGQAFEISGDGSEIIFQDVVVGEVWLCSGQSNMQYSLKQTDDGKVAIPTAHDPLLRWFEKKPKGPYTWTGTTPELAPDLSAVGYFYGRALRRELDVPVGLIVRAVGGTTIQRWVEPESVNGNPFLVDRIAEAQRRGEEIKTVETEKATYDKRNKPPADVATRMAELSNLSYYSHKFGGLYQRMIKPLQPYAIRGVIWYQGEFNNRAGQAFDYAAWQRTLIDGWRAAWGQGDFPFLYVQLQALGNATTPVMRNSQRLTLTQCSNTAMAVICDQSMGLHPPKKELTGERLALAARETVYEQEVVGLSPRLIAAAQHGGKFQLTFDHIGKGLRVKNDQLTGFMLCGPDGKFVQAQAEILSKNTVEVWAETISEARTVRYAWENNPRKNMSLENSGGLPASPFETKVFSTE